MSEEAIYDEGYYQGIKDAVQTLLIMHMEGSTLIEIRDRLVNMRANSKIEYQDSLERAGFIVEPVIDDED
jgi:hypothetical protein